MPKGVACVMYRAESESSMKHTGINTGDGFYIDARGSSYGVVKKKYADYPFTHWGIPIGLYSSEELSAILEGNTEAPETPTEEPVVESSKPIRFAVVSVS